MNGEESPEVFLIVTADDFGMTPERDRGIVQAKKEGIVTNTSLLVNGATAARAAQEAMRCGLSMGLHLNLTEGSPICDAAQVPSLLARGPKWWPRKEPACDGDVEELQFRGKEGIRQALKDGKLSMIEVELEVRAQLEAFRAIAGSVPTYLDGHQHIHVLPGLAGVIARVASSVGVKCVRIPSEDGSCFSHVEPPKRRQFYEQVSCQASASRAAYAEEGIVCPSDFIGYGLMGDDITKERLKERLLQLAASRRFMDVAGGGGGGGGAHGRVVVGEYMNHVGYASAEGDDFAKSAGREKELGVLTDPELRDLLKQHNIKRVDYAEMLAALESRGFATPAPACEFEQRRRELPALPHQAIDSKETQPSLPAGASEDRCAEGARRDGASKGRIVFVASLTKATGNAMTAMRMQGIAEAAGWETVARDVSEIADAEAMERVVQEEHASAAFGVHLHRAGRLFLGLSVPYCLFQPNSRRALHALPCR